MINIDNYPYDRQAIIDAIHSKTGSREWKFRYDLLDQYDNKIGELDSVIDGEVSMSAMAQIKRTAKFTIKDKGEINWLSDRIQPFAMLKIPAKRRKEIEFGGKSYFLSPFSFSRNGYGVVSDQDIILPGGYVAFPLGVFLLASPVRKDQSNQVYRDVEAYDGLLVLRDDKFIERHYIASGTNYKQAVISILEGAGIFKHNIQDTDKSLPRDIEFPPGEDKLGAINNLLSAINYTPIHVDVYGFYTAMTYRSPAVRGTEYTYKDDELSIITRGMEEEFDLFDVPNKWVCTLSNPEEPPLVSSHTNASLSSPTSTINRGRAIVDFRELDNVADQESLNAYVQRIAFEASQIYGKLRFETGINPLHDYFDVLDIQYKSLGINDKYSETSWTMPLRAGETMKHEVRKIVQI